MNLFNRNVSRRQFFTVLTIVAVFILILSVSLGFQMAMAKTSPSQPDPVSEYLQENYGVDSIEEYRLKVEREAWQNYSRYLDELYANETEWWNDYWKQL